MSDKKTITIPQKALAGLAPVIAIIVVLLARDKAPEVLLFLVGVGCGIFIGKVFFGKSKIKKVKESVNQK